MCFETKCSTCGKTSWAGCGRHVASVYGRIPEGHHCQCKEWPGVVKPDQKTDENVTPTSTGAVAATATATATDTATATSNTKASA